VRSKRVTEYGEESMSDSKGNHDLTPITPSDVTLAATSPAASPVKVHLTDHLQVDALALNLDVQTIPSPDAKSAAPNAVILVQPSDGDEAKGAEEELEKPTLNPTNFWFYPLDVYKKHKVSRARVHVCVYCIYMRVCVCVSL
jgi:hypothetical protein